MVDKEKCVDVMGDLFARLFHLREINLTFSTPDFEVLLKIIAKN